MWRRRRLNRKVKVKVSMAGAVDGEELRRFDTVHSTTSYRTTLAVTSAVTADTFISGVKFGTAIGKGAFGEVFKGAWQGSEVALKAVMPAGLSVEAAAKADAELKAEIGTLQQMRHPNVLNVFGLYHRDQDSTDYIVTEFMPEGSLESLLRSDQGKRMSTTDMTAVALQVAAGMQHVHKKGVVHRDLASRNVLIEKKRNDAFLAKVADFGMARAEENADEAADKWPLKWMAPETTGEVGFSTASDVWAFGVLMWEIFSRGEVPYKGMSNRDAFNAVRDEQYRLPQPHGCPDDMYALMLLCWSEDPKQRPSFDALTKRLEAVATADKRRTQFLAPTAAPATMRQGSRILLEPHDVAYTRSSGGGSSVDYDPTLYRPASYVPRGGRASGGSTPPTPARRLGPGEYDLAIYDGGAGGGGGGRGRGRGGRASGGYDSAMYASGGRGRGGQV